MSEITGYEIREDVFDDGTPVFDVYQLMNGDAEYIDSYYDEDSAMRHARICAEDNGLDDDIEIPIHRRSGRHDE